ncbi:group II intron reverse transcriptase/maturase [Streptococcus equi subsp. zooepidemicus]|uniref:group II intron reverse transcriptase/maturase n=1 Tax=Streptococcus equi TaxID=1336 RepID=UPI0024A95C43|nr:group II intron reverse transcriptase/maturase [Streptococcus equi]MCD3443542.1 group II intron reverse transcriptase/maturase [Streptococcus equi subsp. zooepidemicus]MDI6043913.1 group II intron reverse transcriptase/maturase [Streptococcus equi subsp. zooepidemicus]HEL0024036.1 group II intron reverse transcriptase/maturase [Streptococcus equi subsp. zooepidemicus]HEL1117461.1 group II intron reverse transcriptase/maturase [Streptococcus equi subsp. zooepidemicus]HEL1171635.1 group II in
MRNPQNVLNNLTKHSKDKNYQFKRLYRLLYNEEMYLVAYQMIYANPGHMTPGVDELTIDGMSIARIDQLIDSLKDESYQPHPSRRTYIPKKNGKLRPLGIPTFDDKLLQQVIKMILEAIYEGQFESSSHGFRPNKSCHTALTQIQKTYTGTKWFIEGDIKSFFDNINHDVMIQILRERITDERFLRLIRKFLNAGYVEDWKFYKTYSGTPQGGIISPILANIYLDKFDKYMTDYVKNFCEGKYRKRTPEYRQNEIALGKARRTLECASTENQRQEAIQRIRQLEKERVLIPHSDPMDSSFKRLTYTRYADDFICGVIGSKEDARRIKADIKDYLEIVLKLELSEEKTLITNARDKAKFLGYHLYIRQSNLAKRDSVGRLVRNYTGRLVLEVSIETIRDRLLSYGAMKMTYHRGHEVWKPTARYFMKDCDDLEILERYNAEIRGFYNYYCIANNSSILHRFKYIMEYSMYKTYATKYRTTKSHIIRKYKKHGQFRVQYIGRKGDIMSRYFYNGGFRRQKKSFLENDNLPNTAKYFSRTNLIDRLKANRCEYCQATDSSLEIHHLRKLKDLKGKTFWERLMISRQRKTIVLCKDCHKKLHHGKLD